MVIKHMCCILLGTQRLFDAHNLICIDGYAREVRVNLLPNFQITISTSTVGTMSLKFQLIIFLADQIKKIKSHSGDFSDAQYSIVLVIKLLHEHSL